MKIELVAGPLDGATFDVATPPPTLEAPVKVGPFPQPVAIYKRRATDMSGQVLFYDFDKQVVPRRS